MTLPQPSDGFEWTQEPWGPALRCVPLDAVAAHVFTAANLRLVHDAREWTAVAARMGVPPGQLRLIRQVHGIDVAIVRAGAGGGWESPEADVIVSDDPDVALGVRVADCAPILLADRRRAAVGAAHAGWRGTARNAAGALVRAMVRTFGSKPEDLVAAIGPCLGACCGEVGPEVAQAFRDGGHAASEATRWFTPGPGDRSYLDLPAANRDQLERAGIPPPQIHSAGICTRTHPALLHSYRARGPAAGRMVALIRCGGS